MTERVLEVEQVGTVRAIALQRPASRNALDRRLVRELSGALAEASADAGVRAIVLTGSGGSFCAGADLKTVFADDPDVLDHLDERVEEYHAIIRAIAFAPKPVVAAVDGAAVGFGCDLALACDLRVVSTGGYFEQKFVKIGLMPDGGGTFWLSRLVGTGRAMELVLRGRRVEAPEALALGIANRVVPPAALRDEALALATELAAGPPLAIAEIKRSLLEGLAGGLEAALAREKAGQVRCLRSEDALEGISAWAERRPPTFRGR